MGVWDFCSPGLTLKISYEGLVVLGWAQVYCSCEVFKMLNQRSTKSEPLISLRSSSWAIWVEKTLKVGWVSQVGCRRKKKEKRGPRKWVKRVKSQVGWKRMKEKTTRVSHKHVSGLNIEDKPSKPGVYMECLHCTIAESHFVLNLKSKAFKFFHYDNKIWSNCAGKNLAVGQPWDLGCVSCPMLAQAND